MADDVTVDNGGLTDYDIATDDDGSGNHVQIVKLAQAADGSRTPIAADSDGILVNLGANNDVTVPAGVSVDGVTAVTASDSITALNDTAALTTASRGNVGVTIVGTWVATLVAEASTDAGSTWFAIPMVVPDTGATVASTAANGSWFIPSAGAGTVRIRASAYTSGTATVSLRGGFVADVVRVATMPAVTVANPPTEYAEDTAATAGEKVTMAGVVRQDSQGSLVDADGDRTELQVNSQGYLKVAQDVNTPIPIVDLSGLSEDTQSAAGETVYMAGVVRRDSRGTLVDTDNDVTELQVNSSGDLRVDGSAVTQPVSGTVTAVASGDHTVIGKAADGAAVSGNPVLVAGQDGSNVQSLKTDAAGELQVDVLTMPSTVVTATDLDIRNLDVATDDVRVGGMAASDIAVADNPVTVGGRASTAVPTAVSADGDAVFNWLNRSGATVVTLAPHVGLNSDPWALVHEAAQYTAAQTSTVLVAGGASEKIVVTNLQIQAFSTTAGTCIVYFGTGAYARGTNRAIFDGEFKPSATLAPGVNMQGPFISGANGDDILVTTVGDVDVTISVWYYVVV